MFINFNGTSNLDIEEVQFEVKIGNQVIERRKVSAPKEMLMGMFMNYVQQMARQPQHMYLCMSGEEMIWDRFENKSKAIPKCIEFWNWDYQEENFD